jgi:hypothetical protein
VTTAPTGGWQNTAQQLPPVAAPLPAGATATTGGDTAEKPGFNTVLPGGAVAANVAADSATPLNVSKPVDVGVNADGSPLVKLGTPMGKNGQPLALDSNKVTIGSNQFGGGDYYKYVGGNDQLISTDGGAVLDIQAGDYLGADQGNGIRRVFRWDPVSGTYYEPVWNQKLVSSPDQFAALKNNGGSTLPGGLSDLQNQILQGKVTGYSVNNRGNGKSVNGWFGDIANAWRTTLPPEMTKAQFDQLPVDQQARFTSGQGPDEWYGTGDYPISSGSTLPKDFGRPGAPAGIATNNIWPDRYVKSTMTIDKAKAMVSPEQQAAIDKYQMQVAEQMAGQQQGQADAIAADPRTQQGVPPGAIEIEPSAGTVPPGYQVYRLGIGDDVPPIYFIVGASGMAFPVAPDLTGTYTNWLQKAGTTPVGGVTPGATGATSGGTEGEQVTGGHGRPPMPGDAPAGYHYEWVEDAASPPPPNQGVRE